MNDLINIRDYKNTKCFIPKFIYSWVTIFIFLTIICILIIFNFNFDFYYNTKATYVKNNSMLKVSVLNNDINKITENNKLIINNKEYEYEINKITNQVIQGIDMQQYSNILIDLKLDKKYKVENNLLDIKVKYDSKKIFEIIKNFILGEGN